MLTGRLPYIGSNRMEVAYATVNTPIPSAVKINANLPDELDVLLAKVLAKDPTQRPQSVKELLAQMARLPQRRTSPPGVAASTAPAATSAPAAAAAGGSGGAGGGDTGEAFRVLMDHLQVDDCGWCFRTNLRGRIDLERTLKAIESAYNCELRASLGEKTVKAIAQALEAGAFEDSASTLARTIKERARALSPAPGDDLVERIVEAAVYWADPEVVASVEGLGPHLREWVIGFLISTVVKMASYHDFDLEVRRSAGDLGGLLPLLEVETSFMLDSLPQAIRRAVESSGGWSRSAVWRSSPAAARSSRRRWRSRRSVSCARWAP